MYAPWRTRTFLHINRYRVVGLCLGTNAHSPLPLRSTSTGSEEGERRMRTLSYSHMYQKGRCWLAAAAACWAHLYTETAGGAPVLFDSNPRLVSSFPRQPKTLPFSFRYSSDPFVFSYSRFLYFFIIFQRVNERRVFHFFFSTIV